MTITVKIENINYDSLIKMIQKNMIKNNRDKALIINPILDVLNKDIPDNMKQKIIIECIKSSNVAICKLIGKLMLNNGIVLDVSDINIE